jgi:hypothetical protein
MPKRLKLVAFFAIVIVLFVSFLVENSKTDSYFYQSHFNQGTTGDLHESYWVASPELVSGSYVIENGMLKLTSNDAFKLA